MRVITYLQSIAVSIGAKATPVIIDLESEAITLRVSKGNDTKEVHLITYESGAVRLRFREGDKPSKSYSLFAGDNE